MAPHAGQAGRTNSQGAKADMLKGEDQLRWEQQKLTQEERSCKNPRTTEIMGPEAD